MVLLLRALADPVRLRIFGLLLRREMSVNEITGVLSMGQSRISRHLRILAAAGLLRSRRDGLWVHYSADRGGPASALIAALGPLIGREPALARDIGRSDRYRRETSRRSNRFFDRVASDWSEMKKEILGGFDLPGAVLRRMSRCRTAVDLGCGTGDMLQVLRRKAGRVIGVDSSSRMLAEAKSRFAGHSGFDLRMGEMEHLPVGDAEADFVLMSLVLHHLASPAAGIVEANRILRRGGRLLIVDLAKHDDESLRTRFGDRWLGFGAPEVRRWLSEYGFSASGGEVSELADGLKANLLVGVKKRNVVSQAVTA